MSYGRRSFAIAGPSFWNSLPVDLRHSSSLTEFKSKLKTHLFRGATDSNQRSSLFNVDIAIPSAEHIFIFLYYSRVVNSVARY